MITPAFLPVIGLLVCILGELFMNLMIKPVLRLSGLILLYLGGSILLLSVCSFQMCAALFVCGIGCTVLMGTALRENPVILKSENNSRLRFAFRLLFCLIPGILAYTASELLRYWLPVHFLILTISLWTGIMCLFNLAIEDELFYRCIWLQSFCFAFTLCYVYMENSVLIVAFLAAINLLISFGCTILSMGNVKENKEETI